MTTLKAGDKVRVVEHDDATRLPAEGGRVLRAEVIAADGTYVSVAYENGQGDTFWRESGWRAWDGGFRWRIEALAAVAEKFSTEGEQ
jgi:hypothetical protein